MKESSLTTIEKSTITSDRCNMHGSFVSRLYTLRSQMWANTAAPIAHVCDLLNNSIECSALGLCQKLIN